MQYFTNLMNLAMKRMKVLLVFITCLLLMHCTSVREMSALRACAFRLEGADHFLLAGTSLDGVHSLQDLGFINTARIMEEASRGKMPVQFDVHVLASNPNASVAAVNTLAYKVILDDAEILDGQVDQRIELPAKSTLDIPIKVTADLFKVMQGKSAQAMINLILNLWGEGKTASHLKVKVKPTILVGKKPIKYPGYITLSKDFQSQ